MSETSAIVQSLKRLLRQQNITYADIANTLSMSEANIKRMFAEERISLDRLEAICRLLSMSMTDFFSQFEESRQRIKSLSIEQEKELVNDTQLLLVAVCVRNELQFEEILGYHHISATDLIRALAKLDRLKIIDLLPNNKIKLLVAPNFSWLPGGPIEQFFEKAILKEFTLSKFEPDSRLFVFGLLSEKSKAIVRAKMQALSHEFIQLQHQDRSLPWDQKSSIGMLLACRHFEFSILKPYVK
ncbi:helix-turn-helix domain-containing protein [Aurantivibrio plasticivorans]